MGLKENFQKRQDKNCIILLTKLTMKNGVVLLTGLATVGMISKIGLDGWIFKIILIKLTNT